MRRFLFAASALALTFTVPAQAGIDPKNLDASAEPAIDFDQYANGGWKAANPVPPAYPLWGGFSEVAEQARTALHAVLERAAARTDAKGVERLVGDFYASAMNEQAIEAAGLTPLAPEWERLAVIHSPADVQAALGHLHTYGINAGFRFGARQDPKNTGTMIATVMQGGLGLPDRDYYLRTDAKSEALRTQYVKHVANLLKLAGEAPESADASAAAVMTLETALARGSKSRVALRDPNANYHKLPSSELGVLAPHFDWAAYFGAVGIKDPGALDIGQPEFLQAFDAALVEHPVAAWQAYLRWHLLNATAPYLNAAFVDENFDFHSRQLSGAKELLERWKRVTTTIDALVGEAVGPLYVAENFPPASKQRMLELVENLRTALAGRLKTLEWMDDATRTRALEKIRAFNVKIGYPDRWIDYAPLTIDRGAYVLNVLRARAFNERRDLAKINQPVDRAEWHMTPATVNAYYSATMNEIVFPAAILQPPFFDPQADDATNYGGIGAVIGHEMTHGFDDKGRQFAADGTLTDWWTPECAARFSVRAAGIVKQFSSYVAIDDLHVNGELTQGENIADLGGLKIAFAAWQLANAAKPSREINGFTPEQRFFLSWATVWRQNIRPERLRLQVNTDPHSPAHFRINGPLSNLEEFWKAFNVPAGAPLHRTGPDHVSIW